MFNPCRDAVIAIVCLSLVVTCATAASTGSDNAGGGTTDEETTSGKTTILPSSTTNPTTATKTPVVSITTLAATILPTTTLSPTINTATTTGPSSSSIKPSPSLSPSPTGDVTNPPTTNQNTSNPPPSSTAPKAVTTNKTVISTLPSAQPTSTITPSTAAPTQPPTTAAPTSPVDYCAGAKCKHGANCTSGGDNYTCACAPGWTGWLCDADVNDCDPNPCKHEGNCTDKGTNSYSCTCKTGWTNSTCEQVEYCHNATCENNATCISGADNYTCTCPHGLTGWHCDTDVDDCGPNPCINAGNCTDAGLNNFTCDCTEEWLGKTCEIYVDNQCASSPCGYGYCMNQNRNYTCYCNDGSVGLTCVKPNFCSNASVCGINEKCTSTNETHDCGCIDGYHYKSRDSECEEILLFNGYHSGRVSGESEMYGPYFAGGGFPYFGHSYTAFYVNRNGYIVLDRHRNLKNPIPKANDWPTDVKLVAPLWYHWVPSEVARLTIIGFHKHQTDDKSVLMEIEKLIINKTSEAEFAAEFALVVTWRDAIPYPADQYKGFQNVTIQCTLVTDGGKSFAVFAYDDNNLADLVLQVATSGYSTADNATILPAVSNVRNRSVYGLFNVSATLEPNDNYKCLDKLAELPVPDRTGLSSNNCPCMLSQARIDMRFKFDEGQGCTVDRFSSAPAKCCYDKSYGTLLMGEKGAGYLQNTNHTIQGDINTANNICCGNNSTVCGVFYNKYHSDSCESYETLTMAQYWGNPVSHLADGSPYIFNGFGEYYLAGDSSTDSWLKGRLTRLRDINITVLTEVTIQVNYATVHVTLNASSVQFSNDDGPLQDGNITYDFTIAGDTLIYNNGIYMEVKPLKQQLLVSLYVPESQTNFLNKGLIAVMKAPSVNGTWIDETKIPENITATVPPPHYTSFTVYRDVLYQSDADSVSHATASCGNNTACLIHYDPMISKPEDIVAEEQNKERNADILKMKPPAFTSIPSIWNVSVAEKEFSLDVTATTNVTFTLKTNEINPQYTYNETTGKFTWNLSSLATPGDKDFQFVIEDSHRENSTYTPVVIMCPCDQTTQCDYNIVNYLVQRSTGSYFTTVCRCPDNKEGELCQTNTTDRCADCYPGASCNETQLCTCPMGLVGDGINCYDENECADNVCGDNANCENHIGYHNCSCFSGYEMKNKKCTDINECKSKTDRCPDYEDELRQLCENTNGSCKVSCRPMYRKKNCATKVDYLYAGKIVFAQVAGRQQRWTDALNYKDSNEFKNLAEKVEVVVLKVLNETFPNKVLMVTVTKFVQITAGGSRQKRAADSDGSDISATYEVGMNEQASETQLSHALAAGYNCDPQNVSCILGSGKDTLVGVSRSKTNLNDDYNLCSSDQTNNCHATSTECVSANGTFTCRCRAGFMPWPLQDNACEDIDECGNKTPQEVCGERAITCTNQPGSYTCGCQSGYTWSENKCQLTDHCRSGPCQNGASCVNTPGEEPGYACKCPYEWTGATCSEKDSEAERRRVIIIAVSASLGGLCFILLVALCCVCTRRKGSSKVRKHDYALADEADNTSINRIPRPQVGRNTDNLEMERQESFTKHTKFDRNPDPQPASYTNQAYNGSTSGATGEYDRL